MMNNDPEWRDRGVRIVPRDRLDPNTPQTPGMHREAAISHASAGAEKIWAGTVTIHPGARTGPHHHGQLESVIYVVRGHARMRWGEGLEYVAEAGPGDFIYVSPLRSPSGDQCKRGRRAELRSDSQRSGARRREPRHHSGRGAGERGVGGSAPPFPKALSFRHNSHLGKLLYARVRPS
jgi:uncharacterized RmlC-like cupin family protein